MNLKIGAITIFITPRKIPLLKKRNKKILIRVRDKKNQKRLPENANIE